MQKLGVPQSPNDMYNIDGHTTRKILFDLRIEQAPITCMCSFGWLGAKTAVDRFLMVHTKPPPDYFKSADTTTPSMINIDAQANSPTLQYAVPVNSTAW